MATINRETFEKLKERMKAKFPILLEGYLKDAKSYMGTIESNMFADGELSQIIEASHSLKSSSGLLGIVDVHAEAEKVEYTGKGIHDTGSNNVEPVRMHVEHLKMAFAAVETELGMELEKARTAQTF